jgi:hypothetical protein
MKKWLYLCLAGALSLTLPPLRAQDKDHAKPSVPVKVQLVFAEYDGEKKISSIPYVFGVLANERGVDGTSLRVGVRIPVETDSKDQKITYMDVGSNIDCRMKTQDDGRFSVSLAMERSTLYPNKSAEGERLVSEPNGLPLVHQFRTNVNLLLKDGQTAEIMLSTDPLNGHTMRVSVTINVEK